MGHLLSRFGRDKYYLLGVPDGKSSASFCFLFLCCLIASSFNFLSGNCEFNGCGTFAAYFLLIALSSFSDFEKRISFMFLT